MSRVSSPLIALGLIGLISVPAQAETTVESPKAPALAEALLMPKLDGWMNFLQSEGYKTIDKSTPETLLIESAAEGVRFHVQFFGCDGVKDCQSVQFWSGFDMDKGSDLERINVWNRDKRYGKAYLDGEMDPFLEMDVNMSGGLPMATAKENMALWTAVLDEFQEHIDW
jgi:hypothetical protein